MKVAKKDLYSIAIVVLSFLGGLYFLRIYELLQTNFIEIERLISLSAAFATLVTLGYVMREYKRYDREKEKRLKKRKKNSERLREMLRAEVHNHYLKTLNWFADYRNNTSDRDSWIVSEIKVLYQDIIQNINDLETSTFNIIVQSGVVFDFFEELPIEVVVDHYGKLEQFKKFNFNNTEAVFYLAENRSDEREYLMRRLEVIYTLLEMYLIRSGFLSGNLPERELERIGELNNRITAITNIDKNSL